MRDFSALTRHWFSAAFEGPTPVQQRGWQAIADRQHALLIAPTGSGKTLAAFLWCIDRLIVEPPPPRPGTRVLYVSPLKALVYDIERNLRAPLAGIARAAEQRGEALRLPGVDVRTGDTTPRQRREQARHPGDILVTTPESLYLLLGSQARENLASVETVIVDEVHALAPTKRGAHLALSLERLSALCGREPQRIGLSATARPLSEVARFLGGDREVSIVDTSEPPRIDLAIHVPVADMTRPEQSLPSAIGAELAPDQKGMWPVIEPRLLDLIRAHKTTILFVNSRGLCERLSNRLNELAGEPLVRAHHGSLSHAERGRVEELLKQGAIACIVATSSLELGIDMGAVDLCLMVESPGAVARGLQRIGRAGHGVGQVSKGRLFPKHRGDLLEAAVVARRMAEGAIEALSVPDNPLDVLAQQIVAIVGGADTELGELKALVRRAANFRNLPDDALASVLDMLSGRYPSSSFGDLRPRLNWDRERDRLSARRGARMLALTSGGTIPDRGSYGVYLGADGPRVGELDEEMVYETTAGEVFTLGASSWRVETVTRDKVIVSPAPGEGGKLPFWRGDGPGRPIELGRALGAFVREVGQLPEQDATERLMREHGLDALAAKNLLAYLDEQREATGVLPTDRAITVERFRDELGDYRVCILSPFGSRVHAPWALALEARLGREAGFEVQALHSDDGIVLRFADSDELPELDALLPDPDEVEDLVVEQLSHSPLFAGMFRENAARSLLLPRRRPNARTPLWLQRRKSAELLGLARNYPSFPVILETYRSCLRDVFDLDALRALLSAVRRRELRVDLVETRAASPFARNLVFAYIANYLYDGDAPLAERRAHALSLDRNLLRQLLGEQALRTLLDPEVIEQVEAELQALTEERRAGDADAVHDLLRRLGDLSPDEVAARCRVEAEPLLLELERERRIVRLRVGGELRCCAVEDVALYRDALGASPPPGVPHVFLEPAQQPVDELCLRYARTHGPFTAEALAGRYAVPVAQAELWLAPLESRGAIARGEFRPGRSGQEYCDAEVLRRIKRRTLARLRSAVAPVEASALARFLPAWHGIGPAESRGAGLSHLQDVLTQLEGMPLPFGELERAILPARARDFNPSQLDELGASGWLVWVGQGAVSPTDGRVALFRRERVAALLAPPARPDDLDETALALLSHLEQRGACFFAELARACAPLPNDDVLHALYDLVWAGLVTNDTFQPLRAMGRPRTQSSRIMARAFSRASGGRWSLTAELLTPAPSETERAHARSIKLLERHGLVTREVATLEELPGGFSAVYPVLRAMEEAGKIRRGYFVEGLGGAQFAFPGAVDRLRALEAGATDAQGVTTGTVVLSAIDPANAYGWILPWPTEADANRPKPRRVAGAVVVLARGEPVLYLGRGGKHMLTFPAARDPDLLRSAALALAEVARRKRGKALRVEQIDGQDAARSALAPQLTALNWSASYKGLELDASRPLQS